MPHPLRCPNCGRTLGAVHRRRDHRGKPYEKLKLTENVHHVGRFLFRGRYAECAGCGKRVTLPDGVIVEFH